MFAKLDFRLSDRMPTETALALAVCLVVVLTQTLVPEFRRPVADAIGYAHSVVGVVDAVAAPDRAVNDALGGYLNPVYPLFVAGMALIDDSLLSTLHCLIDTKAACDLSGLTSLFVVQGGMAAFTVFFLFMAVRALAGDSRVAWLALAIVLATKIFSGYASQLLTECTAFFFVFLFNWLFARALIVKKPGCPTLVFAGVALGLLILTRPSYQYVVPFSVLVLFLWRTFGMRDGVRSGLVVGLAMGAAAGAVVFPWALRNFMEMGQWTLGTGGSRVLVERLAYNTMTWPEWAVSFIYWLPDFGDNLARSLFVEDLWKRLTWYEPGSFYMMGRGDFFRTVYGEVAKQEPGNGLAFLVREYVWGDLGKHLAVSVSLAFRGQWVGNYVSFVGFILLPFALRILHARGRAGPFIVYCLPSYFILGFYAFVSVNVVRYNEPLVAIFALSIAVVVVRLAELGLGRLRRTPSQTRNQS